jgi:hypothetical protein
MRNFCKNRKKPMCVLYNIGQLASSKRKYLYSDKKARSAEFTEKTQ